MGQLKINAVLVRLYELVTSVLAILAIEVTQCAPLFFFLFLWASLTEIKRVDSVFFFFLEEGLFM